MAESIGIGLKAFDKYEKFYTNFVRPPLAPVYHPTLEEFADPIAYVAKIKGEAEKYGVVKIVPPKEFNPKFAIDKGTFTFTPRIQRLSEIEAIVRERNAFTERLVHYWELQGTVFRQPILENRPVDLFKAQMLIRCEGGFEAVCENKRWTAVAKGLGLKSNQAGSKLKDHYVKLIIPYLENIEKKEVKREMDDDEEEKEEKKEEGNRGLGEGRSSMQGGNRHVKKAIKRKNNNKDEDSIVICSRCERSDELEKMVKCENCPRSLHLFCMHPPMKELPKNGWHCPSCTESRVRRMGADEGFTDSSCSYTLNTFTTYANDYKKMVFKKEPKNVSLDEMENMYWKNMLNGEYELQVKYGADLMVSKVGSGFSRKTDSNLRGEDRDMANHPWNLNNMPVVKDSVLSHIDSSISGMMVPWVYVGMAFSTFCWHTEDHWTYSVNYNHWGEPKIWYGMGADEATKFEKVVETICPSLFRIHSDILHHMTVAVNPHLLRSRGIPVYTVHQNPGEFVITFPRAYHAGFNQGLNFAEAVNFAPIDWLSMGRNCMSAYSEVGRNCVFSHDELVMKIARSFGTLSTSMAVATLEELKVIHGREVDKRKFVTEKGVKRRERLIFGDIEEDDDKMCRYCKTTLFMSGVRCGHGRSVCIDHIQFLCHKCPLEEVVLLYSYEVEELLPIMDTLKERTKKFEEWENKAKKFNAEIERGEKPDLDELEAVVEEGRREHFPMNGMMERLNTVVTEDKKIVMDTIAMMGEGVRLRSTTRNQRADKRCTVVRLKGLVKRLEEMSVKCETVMDNVKEMLSRVDKWMERMDGAMKKMDEDEIENLVEEAEDQLRNVNLDLEKYKRRGERQKWMRDVEQFIKWTIDDCDEMSEEWMDKKRWTMDNIRDMVDRGYQLGAEKCHLMEEIVMKRKEAMTIDIMSTQTMERNSNAEGEKETGYVEETWKTARKCDWLDCKGINQIRLEIFCILRIRSFEQAKQYSVFDIIAWIRYIEMSKSIRRSELEALKDELKRMKTWTENLRNIFELEKSYHSLYEMLICRENVVALSIGQKPTLRIEKDELSSIELWKPVHMFETHQIMTDQLSRVYDQFPTDIAELRRANDEMGVRQSCPCLSETFDNQPVLVCIVCNAKTHLSCGWWNEYFGRLPPGCFLCVRCMRSRRPLIEDVKKVVDDADDKWMEGHVVRLCLSRLEETREEVKIWHSLWKEDRHDEEINYKLSTLLITLLSLEITDSSLLATLTEPISILFRRTLENQRDAWDELRVSSPSILNGQTLFKNGRRRNGGINVISPMKRKKKEEKEGEWRTCAYPQCYTPTSRTEWVKCILCKRWYHILCTGLCIEVDEEYKCCEIDKIPSSI